MAGRLGDRLAKAGAAELSAVLFTHLHQDHARGATWSGELTFPAATGLAHAAEEVLPHVRAIDAAGHTPGHTAFMLEAAVSGCSASATRSMTACS